MKFKIAAAGMLAFAGIGAAAIGVAQAQTTTPASQVIGGTNSARLAAGLSRLGATLDNVRTALARGTIGNQVAVKNDLSAIRGTLIGINGTVAALASRSSNVALGGSAAGNVRTGTASSPGLPNTGGGGARFLK